MHYVPLLDVALAVAWYIAVAKAAAAATASAVIAIT